MGAAVVTKGEVEVVFVDVVDLEEIKEDLVDVVDLEEIKGDLGDVVVLEETEEDLVVVEVMRGDTTFKGEVGETAVEGGRDVRARVVLG